MDTWFSDTLPLMSIVFEYLNAKDVAKWRQSGRRQASDTFVYAPHWQKYVHAEWNVSACSLCNAIRGFYKTEWCGLCENRVCVDHLERCHACGTIHCSACFCCNCY